MKKTILLNIIFLLLGSGMVMGQKFSGKVNFQIKVKSCSARNIHDHNGKSEVEMYIEDYKIKKIYEVDKSIPRDSNTFIEISNTSAVLYQKYININSDLENDKNFIFSYLRKNNLDIYFHGHERDRNGKRRELIHCETSILEITKEANITKPGIYIYDKIISIENEPYKYKFVLEFTFTPVCPKISNNLSELNNVYSDSIITLRFKNSFHTNVYKDIFIIIDEDNRLKDFNHTKRSSYFIVDYIEEEYYPCYPDDPNNLKSLKINQDDDDDDKGKTATCTRYVKHYKSRHKYWYNISSFPSYSRQFNGNDEIVKFKFPKTEAFHYNARINLQGRTKNGNIKSLDSENYSIDVFPKYTDIRNAKTHKVLCNGESTGKYSFDLDPPFPKDDLPDYFAGYWYTIKNLSTNSNIQSAKIDKSIPNFEVGNLKKGKYALTINNIYYNKVKDYKHHSDMSSLNSKDKKNFPAEDKNKEIFLLGHKEFKFNIEEPDKIIIKDNTNLFSPTGNCREYKLDIPQNNIDGGTKNGKDYEFGLSNSNFNNKIIDGSSMGYGTEHNYDVYIKDANDCIQKFPKQKLITYDKLGLNIGSVDKIKCFGGSSELDIEAVGGSGNYFAAIDNTKDWTNFKNGKRSIVDVTVGNHDIFIKDNAGCITSQTVDYEQNPEFILDNLSLVDQDGFNISCFGKEDAIVNLKFHGGKSEYEYKIYDQKKNLIKTDIFLSEGENSINNLKAGIYNFEIKDKYNCKTIKQNNINITQANRPNIDLLNKYIFDGVHSYKNSKSAPKDKRDFEFELSNTQAGINYDIESDQALNSYDYKFTGDNHKFMFEYNESYPEIKITSSRACVFNYDNFDLLRPNSLKLNITKNKYGAEEFNIKRNKATDQIRFDIKNGIAPYKISLFRENTKGIWQLVREDETKDYRDKFYPNLEAGKYKMEIRYADDKISKDAKLIYNYNEASKLVKEFEMIEPDPISIKDILADYSGYQIKCNGETTNLELDIKGGIKPYKVELEKQGAKIASKDNIDNYTNFNNLYASDYKVRVTDLYNNKLTSENIAITQTEPINIDYKISDYIGGNAIRCFGMQDSVKIIAKGGVVPSPENGFKYEYSLIGSHYIRSSQKEHSFKNLVAGDYKFRLSDNNNCISELDLHLSQPDKLCIEKIDNTIPSCHINAESTDELKHNAEISAKISGGIKQNNKYLFKLEKQNNSLVFEDYDNQTTEKALFQKLGYGIYNLKTLDANRCMIQKTVNIDQNPELIFDKLTNSNPLCYKATDGSIDIHFTGGTTYSTGKKYRYEFSKNDKLISSNSQTDESLLLDKLGEGKYKIVFSDKYGCAKTLNTELFDPEEMKIDFFTDYVSEFNATDGKIKAKVSGGWTGKYRYKWYENGELIRDENSNKISNLAAGDYSLEVWDSNNCPFGNT
ncbi:MAG: hypothetical protein N4A49_05915, partial [Marinifilaceae bacterium]|nr:hypothetical protein [Marinifilaceae bacterium]